MGSPSDTPIFRHASAIGVSSSAWRSANAICSPVKFSIFQARTLPYSGMFCFSKIPLTGIQKFVNVIYSAQFTVAMTATEW
jgi:hypothetical protein